MDTASSTLNLFKALSDECRLRILRAVSQAELSVAELVRVLGQPQSTVSRHLKPLRETGLLETRRNGTSVFYHRGPAFSDPELNQVIDRSLAQISGANEDKASVRLILNQRISRNRDFFDDLAGRYGSLTEPGGGWSAVAAALAIGFSGCKVADVGAGEGALTLSLARFCELVVAVDLSPRMLMTLRDTAEAAGLGDKVQTEEGELEKLPIEDGEMDAVFISQALHHASQPAAAIKEAARVLRPGGRLLILDLIAHEQEWVRDQYADLWLGFEPKQLELYFTEAGLQTGEVAQLPGATPDLPILLMTAQKPKMTKDGL
ncbi:metalloregulator ArsR/SmtB family transcription factor [Kiritimatiellota bacterium B12222]|nr:metalloregulator ArsR/SmtB family transcription factor [Kiritimatiellota bacterium B12222]